MDFNIVQVLPVLVVLVIYGLVIMVITSSLRVAGVPARVRTLLAFLIFGVGLGVWVSLAWPLDSVTLVNLPAVLFGDALYTCSIQYLGDPGSSQAHYTIPWLFRVPRIYFMASLVFWVGLGTLIQLIINNRQQIYAGWRWCCPRQA
jgi:hypothetical protein